MSGIEYAGGKDRAAEQRGHFEAYVGLSEKTGLPLQTILTKAANNDLGSLFDPSSGKLVYRGADPVRRLESLALRFAGPLCGVCGHHHPGDRCPK